jgi:hypothetical protein
MSSLTLVLTPQGAFFAGQEEGEHSVEPVLHCPQPEKSDEIRAEFCVISREKLKLFDNKAGSGKVMEPGDRSRQERS